MPLCNMSPSTHVGTPNNNFTFQSSEIYICVLVNNFKVLCRYQNNYD